MSQQGPAGMAREIPPDFETTVIEGTSVIYTVLLRLEAAGQHAPLFRCEVVRLFAPVFHLRQIAVDAVGKGDVIITTACGVADTTPQVRVSDRAALGTEGELPPKCR